MWKNYFYQLQIKYNMRVSTKNPLVIRFDGKDVTKDKSINLLDMYKDGFIDCLKKSAWYFSKKYQCYSIMGSDELSLIFPNPDLVLQDLDSEKDNHANEISALLSQYFFDYFNGYYKDKKIFWHGKCFSIPTNKINSYVKYRSGIIKNVMTTYFLIRNNIKVGNISLEERLNECMKYSDYGVLNKIENGILYYNGDRLDIKNFIEGKVVKIDDIDFSQNSTTKQNKISDDFDIEFVDF